MDCLEGQRSGRKLKKFKLEQENIDASLSFRSLRFFALFLPHLMTGALCNTAPLNNP